MPAPNDKVRVLFLCDQNRLRSPTAQALFSDDPRVEVKSAGCRKDASVYLTLELLEWAELIFVMERAQRNLIRKRFKEVYERKRIICLYIEDVYDYMDPALVHLLTERVEPHLAQFSRES